jgi:hypothetical protein
VVAVAELLNLGGIIFLEGHMPQTDTIEKARKEKITLLSTKAGAFEIAGGIYALGLERRKS